MITFKIEIDMDMTIEINELPDCNWIPTRKVIKKKEPANIIPVTKYVISLRDRTFQNEKPIFSHTISSGYGALSIFRFSTFPFLPLNFSKLLLLQQEKKKRIFDIKSLGFSSYIIFADKAVWNVTNTVVVNI